MLTYLKTPLLQASLVSIVHLRLSRLLSVPVLPKIVFSSLIFPYLLVPNTLLDFRCLDSILDLWCMIFVLKLKRLLFRMRIALQHSVLAYEYLRLLCHLDLRPSKLEWVGVLLQLPRSLIPAPGVESAVALGPAIDEREARVGLVDSGNEFHTYEAPLKCFVVQKEFERLRTCLLVGRKIERRCLLEVDAFAEEFTQGFDDSAFELVEECLCRL